MAPCDVFVIKSAVMFLLTVTAMPCVRLLAVTAMPYVRLSVSVIFVKENENENGEKQENNEFVNEN